MILKNYSLFFGFLSCIFILISFIIQLNEIYKKKNAIMTTWTMIITQLFACFCGVLCASINIHTYGMSNLPFLITNLLIFILFTIISYLKKKFKK